MSELTEVMKKTNPKQQKQAEDARLKKSASKMAQQGEAMRKSMGGAAAGRAADPMLKKAGMASPPSYKKGGTVKKTGMAKVHKGEKVLTKDQAKKLPRSMGGKGMGGGGPVGGKCPRTGKPAVRGAGRGR